MDYNLVLNNIHQELKRYYSFEYESSDNVCTLDNFWFMCEFSSTHFKILRKDWSTRVLCRLDSLDNPVNIKLLRGEKNVIISTNEIEVLYQQFRLQSTNSKRNFSFCIQVQDYNSGDGYFNLCLNYPDVPDEILRTVYYFCTNPVPDNNRLYINCDYLSQIDHALYELRGRI